MIKVDNLIIGGGVAALWLNAQARQAGLNTLLVAPDLGGGQSLLSQGIIHGGTKYARNPPPPGIEACSPPRPAWCRGGGLG